MTREQEKRMERELDELLYEMEGAASEYLLNHFDPEATVKGKEVNEQLSRFSGQLENIKRAYFQNHAQ